MKKKRPSFGAVREDLACVLALSLRKTHYICFYRLFWLSNFFEHVLLLLEIETKLIKFCTKLQVKQAKVLLSNCTSLLQCSDPGQLNRLHFFKNFKTKCTFIFVLIQLLENQGDLQGKLFNVTRFSLPFFFPCSLRKYK